MAKLWSPFQTNKSPYWINNGTGFAMNTSFSLFFRSCPHHIPWYSKTATAPNMCILTLCLEKHELGLLRIKTANSQRLLPRYGRYHWRFSTLLDHLPSRKEVQSILRRRTFRNAIDEHSIVLVWKFCGHSPILTQSTNKRTTRATATLAGQVGNTTKQQESKWKKHETR